jgi:hypothetical protein
MGASRGARTDRPLRGGTVARVGTPGLLGRLLAAQARLTTVRRGEVFQLVSFISLAPRADCCAGGDEVQFWPSPVERGKDA